MTPQLAQLALVAIAMFGMALIQNWDSRHPLASFGIAAIVTVLALVALALIGGALFGVVWLVIQAAG